MSTAHGNPCHHLKARSTELMNLLPFAFLLLPFHGPIYKAFGEKLWPLMEELNLTLAA